MKMFLIFLLLLTSASSFSQDKIPCFDVRNGDNIGEFQKVQDPFYPYRLKVGQEKIEIGLFTSNSSRVGKEKVTSIDWDIRVKDDHFKRLNGRVTIKVKETGGDLKTVEISNSMSNKTVSCY